MELDNDKLKEWIEERLRKISKATGADVKELKNWQSST